MIEEALGRLIPKAIGFLVTTVGYGIFPAKRIKGMAHAAPSLEDQYRTRL